MGDDYESLTVKQLKDEVAKREGLTVKSSLRKAEIIEKLREHDQEQASGGKDEDFADSAVAATAAQADDIPAAAPIEDFTDATNGVAHENENIPDAPAAQESEETIKEPETSAPSQAATPPPSIDTAPIEVSALLEPEKEPTPPTHHVAIEPQESQAEPIPSAEIDNAVRDFATIDNTQQDSRLPPVNSQLASENTSISPAELVEDHQKRKRRSMTPPVSAEEVRVKRQKMEAEIDHDVSFDEAPAESTGKEDVTQQAKVSQPPNKDIRKLFSPTTDRQTANVDGLDDYEADAGVEPAQHLATCTIYIGGLKRPLQEPALRRHIESLADSPISTMHLDQVKTHAFVLLPTIGAASRVRASMHNHRFPPNENGRDPLFVDFIPDDKIDKWIETEKTAASRGGSFLRWHVSYTPEGEAIHTEGAGARTGLPPPKGPRNNSVQMAPPAGPSRPSISSASTPQAPPPRPNPQTTSTNPPLRHPSQEPTTSSSFTALSTRFSKTVAKPSLYFKPVPKDLATKRLDILDERTSRGWREADRQLKDEMFRYSFEKGDGFVSTGLSRGSGRHAVKEQRLEREWRRRGGGERRRDGGRRDC